MCTKSAVCCRCLFFFSCDGLFVDDFPPPGVRWSPTPQGCSGLMRQGFVVLVFFCITWLLCVPVGGIPPRARGAYRKSSGFSHTPLTDVQNRPPHNKKTLLKNLVDGFPKPYRSESAPSFFATELLNLESRSRGVCDNPDDYGSRETQPCPVVILVGC